MNYKKFLMTAIFIGFVTNIYAMDSDDPMNITEAKQIADSINLERSKILEKWMSDFNGSAKPCSEVLTTTTDILILYKQGKLIQLVEADSVNTIDKIVIAANLTEFIVPYKSNFEPSINNLIAAVIDSTNRLINELRDKK